MAKDNSKSPVEATESPTMDENGKVGIEHTTTQKKPVEGKSEKKSVRINLLFRPSTKRNIEKLAYVNQTSTNDFINTVMDEYIAAHADEIAKYDSFFEERGK